MGLHNSPPPRISSQKPALDRVIGELAKIAQKRIHFWYSYLVACYWFDSRGFLQIIFPLSHHPSNHIVDFLGP